MRWKRGHTGGIEDRRGAGGLGGFGMGGGGLPIPVGVGGGGGLIVLLLFLALNVLGGFGGSGPGAALDPFGGAAPAEPDPRVGSPADDQVEFVGYVLDDANGLWRDVFARGGRTYEPTTLVLFQGGTSTGCGQASSATGPFYCPADRKVYLELAFFTELRRRFGVPGDFAQAYVVAHEVAHHVQTLLGISGQVRQEQAGAPDRAHELSVALELQADCLAGVWARSVYAQGDLEAGDLEEGLAAASAVGDDRIRAQAGVDVDPETWTHGSAAQRSRWFRAGFDSGDPAACDTFGG